MPLMAEEQRELGEPAESRPRWWEQAVATVLVVGGVLVAGWVIWTLGPGARWWLVHVDGVPVAGENGVPADDKNALVSKELAAALDAIRGRALAVGTGLLAAVAIYYTASNAASARRAANAAYRTAEITKAAQRRTFELTQLGQRQSEEAQRRTHELTEHGQRTDRFTAAVAQLGDASPAIQLGGVHALAGLADHAPDREFRQTCIDVLCAYLRLPYDPDPGDTPAEDQDPAERARAAYRVIREVRHTIIRIIGNHLRDGATVSWQGYDLDFSDVVFDGGDFHSAAFTGRTSFVRARFVTGRVDFTGARFVTGRVDFAGARFEGGQVRFAHARFEGGWVGFAGARFEGGQVTFAVARFEGGQVTFDSARFEGGQVGFSFARFEGGWVGFAGARFEGGQVAFATARFKGGQVRSTARGS
jgi:hypothetical protein